MVMFVYKHGKCLYTFKGVRIQTNPRSYTNELMFVYVYFYFSTRVCIRTYKLVYVECSLFVYKLVYCTYTNNLWFVYEQLLFVYKL